MKNSIKFLTVLVAVFSFIFTSCDEIEDLADIDLNSSLSGKYDLNFKADTSEDVNESMTINLADDSTISAYLNKLKKIEITKITYQITQFTGSYEVDMNMGFYMNGTTIVTPKEYVLSNDKGVEYELTDATILKTVSTTLLNNKQVTLQLKGDYASYQTPSKAELSQKGAQANTAPLTAEIKVTVYFEATANAL